MSSQSTDKASGGGGASSRWGGLNGKAIGSAALHHRDLFLLDMGTGSHLRCSSLVGPNGFYILDS